MHQAAAVSREPHADRIGDIDIGFDAGIENGWILVQRVGWTLMAMLVAAGLTGVFGRGPLAQASVTTPDGNVQIAYERFARFRTPTQMAITLKAPMAGRLDVVVSTSLLEKINVQFIDPVPVLQRAVAGGTDFVFNVDSSGAKPATITFAEQAAHTLGFGGTVQVDREPPLRLAGFVYP